MLPHCARTLALLLSPRACAPVSFPIETHLACSSLSCRVFFPLWRPVGQTLAKACVYHGSSLRAGRFRAQVISMPLPSQRWDYRIRYPSIFLEEFREMCVFFTSFFLFKPHITLWFNSLPTNRQGGRMPSPHFTDEPGAQSSLFPRLLGSKRHSPPFTLLPRGSEMGGLPMGPSPSFRMPQPRCMLPRPPPLKAGMF